MLYIYVYMYVRMYDISYLFLEEEPTGFVTGLLLKMEIRESIGDEQTGV